MSRISLALLLSFAVVACHEAASEPAASPSEGSDVPAAAMPAEAPVDDVEVGGCVRAGCAGQLCVEEGEEPMTTCEERPEYACYREARCERQADGSCGFTSTPELERCLATP